MAPHTAVDSLFRQKTLQDIHGVLKETRAGVESKKQELRELVGDHYRSVLDSSDHIRSMSDGAAKISAGADRVDELLASMRTLAASPPGRGSAPRDTEKHSPWGAGVDEAERDYRVGLRVMSLLEVPESVRGHIGSHEFVQAARLSLVDAAGMQSELDELLLGASPGDRGDNDAALGPGGFDVKALVRQQSLAFRGLPKQIAASCLDAFASPRLEPKGAAEAFVVHLLLDKFAKPVPLLRLFLDRRVELLQNLSGPTALAAVAAAAAAASARAGAGGSGAIRLAAGGGTAGRLSSASTAFEGTVVLGGLLCEGSIAPGGRPSALGAAVEAIAARLPEQPTPAEERAAAEGRPLELGAAALRRRADQLRGALLEPAGADALAVELARNGGQRAREWAPSEASGGRGVSAAAAPRTFVAMLERIVEASLGDELRTCKELGDVHRACSERVLAYRHSLMGSGASRHVTDDEWDGVWRRSCKAFCPAWTRPSDALAALGTAIESACAQVVRERVAELDLDLVIAASEEEAAVEAAPGGGSSGSRPGGAGATAAGAAASLSAAVGAAELADLGREARLRLGRFDERLGEVLLDVEAAGSSLGAGRAISAALVESLEALLLEACAKVQIPDVRPAWPASAGVGQQQPAASPVCPTLRRSAARAAVALDTLRASAAAPDEPSQQPHLWRALRSALASDDPRLAAKGRGVLDSLRERSAAAFCAWARLAIVEGATAVGGEGGRGAAADGSLAAFWKLADDEVPAVCGWGSACFTGKAGAGGPAAGDKKSVPVPVQASPFVFESLALGAKRALEVAAASAGALAPEGAGGGGAGAGRSAASAASAPGRGRQPQQQQQQDQTHQPPSALVAAVKVALSESFMAAYTAEPMDLEKLKRSGMNRLLQWLFDLHFIRLALSSSASTSAPGAAAPAGGAFEAIRSLLERSEAIVLSDPVDRLLYQEVLKASVRSHVQGVRILLAPLFIDNPLYGFRFQQPLGSGETAMTSSGSLGRSAAAGGGAGGADEGFELQPSKGQPFRQVVSRFPLLPVAMGSSFDLDPRSSPPGPGSAASAFAPGLAPGPGGLGAGAGGSAADLGAGAAAAAAAAESLMKQVGSGLGSLGLGKAFPIGGGWASGWSGGAGADPRNRPPSAV